MPGPRKPPPKLAPSSLPNKPLLPKLLERKPPDSLSSDADSSECRDSMLKLRTTTPADATLVEALTAAVKSVEREEETEVATKSSRPPRSMFCT